MGYFYSPAYEIVIVFGLLLLALSAPSHFRARNTGTILYICWTALGNLLALINKLIWHDHVRNIAPVWCDICESIRSPFWGAFR
jgi:pheromone a factor receptor